MRRTREARRRKQNRHHQRPMRPLLDPPPPLEDDDDAGGASRVGRSLVGMVATAHCRHAAAGDLRRKIKKWYQVTLREFEPSREHSSGVYSSAVQHVPGNQLIRMFDTKAHNCTVRAYVLLSILFGSATRRRLRKQCRRIKHRHWLIARDAYAGNVLVLYATYTHPCFLIWPAAANWYSGNTSIIGMWGRILG